MKQNWLISFEMMQNNGMKFINRSVFRYMDSAPVFGIFEQAFPLNIEAIASFFFLIVL